MVRSKAAAIETWVSYRVDEATATSSDYTVAESRRVTFAPGETRKTFTVQTTQDDVVEGDETFVVRFSSYYAIARPSRTPVTVTIADDDTATVSVSGPSAPVTEGGAAAFTVTLSQAAATAATVWASTVTSGLTPAEAGDFESQSLLLTFAPGETEKTFTVQTTDDARVEEDETFAVLLVEQELPEGVTLGTTVAEAIIEDDDGLTVSVADETVSESADAVSLTVTLSQAPERGVTLSWATSDGTAAAGSDYAAASGTLTIPAGETTATATVSLLDDAVDEPDETFTLTVSDPRPSDQVTLSDAEATVRVTDDDDTPTVSLALTSPVVREDGGSSGVLATLSAASSEEVTVTVEAVPVAPADTGDFTQTGTTLTIAAGARRSTGSVTLTAVNDDVVGSDRQVTVTGSVAGGGVAAPSAQTLTIVDDDTASLQFAPNSIEVAEGATASFSITLSRAADYDVRLVAGTLLYTVGNQATAGVDFTARQASVTIDAGDTSAIFEVQTTEDTLVEKSETVGVSFFILDETSDIFAAPRLHAATATIVDDDSATLGFDPTTVVVAEGGKASFTVELSNAVSDDVSVEADWRTVSDTARAYSDYTPKPQDTLTIPSGQRSVTVEVQTTADTLVEGDETFTVKLSNLTSDVSSITLDADTATATITDDDTATLALDPASVTVPEGGAASFTVRLSQAADSDVTFSWQTADGGTAEAGSDYTGQAATEVTISAGDTSATLEVQTTADTVDEVDETLDVTISAGSLPEGVTLGASTATGTIADDDTARVSLLLSPSSIGEDGGESTVTATLTTASSEEVTVTVSATAVSPAVAADFMQTGTTLTIAAGETTSTGTVTITGVDNNVDAADKEVTVSGTAAGGHGVSDPSSRTLTIADDEGVPTLSLLLSPSSIGEDGGESTVMATLTAASSEEVTVTVSATAVSPAVAADFTQSGTTLTIAAGETSSTGVVTITAADNDIVAPDKEVTVGGSATGGRGVATPPSQTLTITNDDTATLAFDPATVTVVEGGRASFTVRLSKAAASDVAFDWQTAHGDAGTDDYTAQAATSVTIGAGDTSATLEVQTAADTLVEGDETFTATISTASLPDGVSLGTATATATITDADTATLAFDPAAVSVMEGGTASFTVRLDRAADSDVTFTWQTAHDTAGSSDYTVQAATSVTITAGDTAATLEVETATDTVVEGDETFTATIGATSLPAGVSLGTATATATITDDDTATLALNPATVTVAEGGTASFTVELSNPASSDVTFSWRTAAGTAEAGRDYTEQTATSVAVAAGETGATLEVETAADIRDEADETFTATISADSLPSGVTLGVATATVTIIDDDVATVTLVLTPASVTENGGESTVTATLSTVTSEAVEVTVSAAAESPATSSGLHVEHEQDADDRGR